MHTEDGHVVARSSWDEAKKKKNRNKIKKVGRWRWATEDATPVIPQKLTPKRCCTELHCTYKSDDGGDAHGQKKFPAPKDGRTNESVPLGLVWSGLGYKERTNCRLCCRDD